MRWMGVAYRVAIGTLPASRPIRDDSVGAQLPPSLSATTPMDLFLAKNAPDTRARALGSMLHTIQDSFARGHVTRKVEANGSFGEIQQFLCYTDQDAAEHGHDDSWGESAVNDLAKTLKVPGAPDAIAASTELAKFYARRAPWDEVEKYLQAGPFRAASNAVPSGAGTFVRK